MVVGALVGITVMAAFYASAGLLFCFFSGACVDRDVVEVCTYGNINDSIPTLGVATANVKYGNTDHRILARIFYGDDDSSGQWSDWRNINNLGCDDRERGQIDFYDDFSNIYERWLAVALYNCGTDGMTVDGIFYWNGTNFRESLIDKFCGNVAGPMVECYGGAYDPAETGSYCFESDQTANYYDYVWIDQNNYACPGILIATGKSLKGNSSEPVGRIYPKADPGVPDCDLYTTTNSHMYPGFDPNRNPPAHDHPVKDPDNVYYKPTETVTITATMMNVIVVAIGVLLCMNVALMVNACRSNKRTGGRGAVKYAKVAYDDASSAQELNGP